MIDDEIIDSINCRWAASDEDRMARKIWPRLDRMCTAKHCWNSNNSVRLLASWRASVYASRIGVGYLANYFCRRCRDKEDEETILHLLGTCLALRQRWKRHLCAYHIYDLRDLSNIDVGCLSRCAVSSRWLQDEGIVNTHLAPRALNR